MKPFLSLLLLLTLAAFANAQGSKKGTASTPPPVAADPAKIHKDVYHNALLSGDVQTAIIAVQYLLAAAPDQKSWRDTLAILYFQGGAYESAILTSQQVLKDDPQNKGMLEISAVSKQSLGLAKESLEDYEKLYPLTRSWYHLYEMASLQLALKRHGECAMTCQAIAESAETKDLQVAIRSQAGEQMVPLNAAAWNVLGVVMVETGKQEEAKAFFKKALEIKTDFALAQANLNEMIKTNPDNK
jgi:tetratricopeptide (TPR) repeat protein